MVWEEEEEEGDAPRGGHGMESSFRSHSNSGAGTTRTPEGLSVDLPLFEDDLQYRIYDSYSRGIITF